MLDAALHLRPRSVAARKPSVIRVRRSREPSPQRDIGHKVTGASGGDQITTGSSSNWGHKVLAASVGDGREGSSVGVGGCPLGKLTGVGVGVGKVSLTSYARQPKLVTSATSPAPTTASSHRGVGRDDPICSCSGSPIWPVSDLLLYPSDDQRPKHASSDRQLRRPRVVQSGRAPLMGAHAKRASYWLLAVVLLLAVIGLSG